MAAIGSAGRPASAIKLYDVVTLALSSLQYITPSLTGRLQCAVIDPLWAEFDTMLQARLQTLTLEDLLRKAADSESGTKAIGS